MTNGPSEDRLHALIVDAYEDVHMGVPLDEIESGAQARSRRRTHQMVAVAAATVLAATIGSGMYLGSGARDGITLPTSAIAAPSTAATRDGVDDSCAARLAEVLVAQPQGERAVPPPLRFDLVVIPSRMGLRIYGDESVEVACWFKPGSRQTWASGDRGWWESSREGQLTNNSYMATLVDGSGDLTASVSYGHAPAGTARVEVHLRDGTKVDAQVEGQWYVAWAMGERFSEVTKVVAHTPGGTYTLPVAQG